MSREIRQTFAAFADFSGAPLDLGFIYIGVYGSDPETTPKSVFWDQALTIPAAQPIRTLNGYPDRSGTPGQIFASGAYSIKVKTAAGVDIYSADIPAEEIDGVPIGQATPAAAEFTDLVAASADFADADAETLTLDGSPVFARSNILGTVSQSGGVPTGAIMERGSNANGEYVRYADGRQECRRKVELTLAVNTASGGLYITTFPAQAFAAEFAGVPFVQYDVSSADANLLWQASWTGSSHTTTAAAGRYVFSNAPRASATVFIDILAVGRWF